MAIGHQGEPAPDASKKSVTHHHYQSPHYPPTMNVCNEQEPTRSCEQVSKVIWQKVACRPVTPRGCKWIRSILTPSNIWFIRRTRVSPPNSISIGLCHFCTAHPCDHHTDIHTTLRVTFVATGRICAMPVMQP